VKYRPILSVDLISILYKLRLTPPIVGCLIAALYIAINPYFRLINLFDHRLLQTESPFYFPDFQSVGGLKFTPNPDGPQAYLNVKPLALVRLQHGKRGPWGPDGEEAVVLDGQQDGQMVITLPPPGADAVTIRADVMGLADAVAEVNLEIPSRGTKRTLAVTSHLRQGGFRIDPWLDPEAAYSLSITAHKAVVIVERLAVFRAPKSRIPPPLDRILLVLSMVWLLVQAFAARKNNFLTYAAGVGVPLIFASFGQLTERGLWASSYFWLALVVGMVVWNSAKTLKMKRDISSLGLWVVLLIAIVVRWSAFMNRCLEPVAGDALAFCSWASQISLLNPFATGVREPFYVWVDFLTLHLLGPNAFQTHIVSILISCATVFMTYRLAKEVSGRRSLGWLAALVMSVSAFAVYSSASADRTQSFELLVLFFCRLMIRPGSWTPKRIFCTALIAAFLCLNWLIAIVQVVTFLFLWSVVRRIPIDKSLSIAMLTALFLAPYFFVSWKQNGDPLYALNGHANYWHNVDVNKVYGYEKERITWTQFLLKDKGIAHVFKKSLEGYGAILFDPTDRYNRVFMGGVYWNSYSYLVFPIYLLGIFLDAFRRRYVVFIMLFSFISISPYFSENSLSPRYFFYAAPFFAYWIAQGLIAVYEFLAAAVRPGRFIARVPD